MSLFVLIYLTEINILTCIVFFFALKSLPVAEICYALLIAVCVQFSIAFDYISIMCIIEDLVFLPSLFNCVMTWSHNPYAVDCLILFPSPE